ncbi:MAG: c-type cytochrome [Hyphomicrobiaceae bacterium]
MPHPRSSNSPVISVMMAYAFGLAATLCIASSASASDDSDAWKRGQALAEEKCARCHAIGPTGKSPFQDAPPFRNIAKRYPVEGLAEALAEGIFVGHPAMPEFVFPPDEIGDLLTYMDSFSE